MTRPASALPPAPRRERTVLPTAAVVGVLAVVVFGGYVTAAALSDVVGSPVDVGGVVRVHPLSGWELAQRFGDPPGVRLTRGSANLDVAAVAFSGSSDDLIREYVSQVLDPDAEQLSVSRIESVTLSSGSRAARVTYVGTFGDVEAPIEGVLTAVVTDAGSGVVFDGWAPFGLLRYALEDLTTMTDTAEVA
ncbi:MAG: hypothetical protein ACXWX6_00370 [Actinomycetota bacterium]